MIRPIDIRLNAARRDLKEIADAANSYGRDGIDVERMNDGLRVSVDRGQFTRWVKTIMNGGTI